ncbi:hypothetical protein C9374_005658 [Naegleria lovaniensis]|uniref:Uncharacterized protein n=1 Tax=Naegleria lovaniensis TaxID=51637 RepID=A0AA88GMF3_NAELO|nr:uncharacterized protein C9374_005658 [Naegleria lovaniensis]KAG2381866.1 hypothetical protein C9374_005658 [Naegleria lovaniensis]
MLQQQQEGYSVSRSDQTRVICICGSTSSGKSTLAKTLSIHYGVETVGQDSCRTKTVDEIKQLKGNFESIESIDFNKFKHSISEMLSKNRNHPLLFVEGYLSCCQQELITQYFDAIIFLDTTDGEVAKKRRWIRTIKKYPNREHDYEAFSQKFDTLIWKYYLKYRNFQMDNIIKSGKTYAVIGVDHLEAHEVFDRAVKFIDLVHKNEEHSIRNDEKYCQAPVWYDSNIDHAAALEENLSD